MSTVLPPQPTSPGVGIRRKGPKSHPSLPLSAFTPPNSGTSERFPLPPSPSTVHPEKVLDASVALLSSDDDLSQWKVHAGQTLGIRIGGLVAALPTVDADIARVISRLAADKSKTSIISVMVPFQLDAPPEELLTTAVLHNSPIPVSLATTFNAKATPQNVSTLKWALEQGRPVDIDVQADLKEDVFDTLEDLLYKATVNLEKVPPIILSNLLPPPHQLELPIVKLMNHTSYRKFQAQVAALSLHPQVYIKYLAPSWEAAPTVPGDSTPSLESNENRKQKEWKRRIKMYLGPVMEAFGYQRIIYGSFPSKISKTKISAGEWYELARESLAELGVEQDVVDAVFYATALEVYS
ncbi:hypothetical protein E1B28_000576 [Marasmius oreades]|uniref:Uncharacterized protein n=1 Tax=Marasmius oreades TaxID=181124 RepID=A0A9P7V1S1_9AGAR|nr:uncharacterized protein E1B28_000576 [Marasmius oreades]KAG7098660.1 hypothetical protein E1B28_000576 [Marasmius oreades]